MELPSDPNPPAQAYADSFDVHRAAQAALLYGVLPFWIVPGFFDYLFHRRTGIERTSGTHESLIHALEMTTAGIPVAMALLFEINASVITAMLAGTLLHEALVIWDVAYAEPLRRPTPAEQHAHSFLEVTPLVALVSILTLHPEQTATFFGRSGKPRRWRLRFKTPPLSRRYFAAIATLVAGLMVLPYGEELVRCYRTDRTFAPHSPPDADAGAAR